MEHDENHTPVQLTIPENHANVLSRWASTGRTLDRSRKLLGDKHPHNEEIDNIKHTTNSLHKSVQEQLWKEREKNNIENKDISTTYGKIKVANFKSPVNITAHIPNMHIDKLKEHKDDFYKRTSEHIDNTPIEDDEKEQDKIYNNDDLGDIGPSMDWLHSEVKKHI